MVIFFILEPLLNKRKELKHVVSSIMMLSLISEAAAE